MGRDEHSTQYTEWSRLNLHLWVGRIQAVKGMDRTRRPTPLRITETSSCVMTFKWGLFLGLEPASLQTGTAPLASRISSLPTHPADLRTRPAQAREPIIYKKSLYKPTHPIGLFLWRTLYRDQQDSAYHTLSGNAQQPVLLSPRPDALSVLNKHLEEG